MKVSVSVGDAKLLVPCGDGQHPVSWLIAEVEKRATAKLGRSPGVTEIQTAAGETLDAGDTLADLVEDSALLVAVFPGAAGSAGAQKQKQQCGEPEVVQLCVQCGEKYVESANAEGACRFHKEKGESRGWGPARYECCHSDKPCAGSKHRSSHHMEYPYAAFYEFACTIYPSIVDIWAKVQRLDFAEDMIKSVEVGTLKEGRFFARSYLGNKLVALRVLTLGEFNALHDGDSIISLADWLVVRLVKPGEIRVMLKAAQDDVATEQVLRYVATGDAPELVSRDVVSSPKPYPSDTKGAGRSLNPVKVTGPLIPEHKKLELVKHPCEGSSALKLEMADETFANQSCWASEGKFDQFLINTLLVTNSSQEDLTIVKVSSEYKTGVSFVPATKTLLGFAYGNERFNFPDDAAPWKIKAGDAVKIAVSTAISLEGEPGECNDTRMRVHASLPQPLRVRVTCHDVHGKAVSLVCEQANRPLHLPTRESVAENSNSSIDIIGYLQCDDTAKLSRKYAAVGITARAHLQIRKENSYSTFSPEALAHIAYKASRAASGQYELEQASEDNCKVFALVDLSKKIVYGIRIVLTTTTSSAEGEFAVPDLSAEWKKITVKAETQAVRPGADIKVKYTSLRPDSDGRLCLYKRCAAGGYYASYESATEAHGEITFKAPDTPGVYDARIHPGGEYDEWVASEPITVQDS